MNPATRLILEDVRCFKGRQSGELRPITLLVGENSTGKSTFLGCYQVITRLLSSHWMPNVPDFNEAPFAFGSFREIARMPNGRGDGREFGIGLGFDGETARARPFELRTSFLENGLQPAVSSYRWTFPHTDAVVAAHVGTSGHTLLDSPVATVETRVAPAQLPGLFERVATSTGKLPERLFLERVSSFFCPDGATAPPVLFPEQLPVLPVAPLRTMPKRTYDPVRETASPDGEHVPMLMARLSHAKDKRWKALKTALVKFGKSSGLFDDIHVKRHGRELHDPFQLRVKAHARTATNLTDVGYGVSQVLPILVDVLWAEAAAATDPPEPRTYLLQQPEVHLHPRAQAELADLIFESYKQTSSRFLVETHSDYVVDRMCILIQQGKIDAKDVSLLYFEPNGTSVDIHSLSHDEHGNLENPPSGYRDFFAKETRRFLGFAD